MEAVTKGSHSACRCKTQRLAPRRELEAKFRVWDVLLKPWRPEELPVGPPDIPTTVHALGLFCLQCHLRPLDGVARGARLVAVLKPRELSVPTRLPALGTVLPHGRTQALKLVPPAS